jgi:hypothetical protein
MERPDVRSGGRAPPLRRQRAPRKKMVQSPLAPPTQPRPKPTTERRNGYSSRPPMDKQIMAPSVYRDGLKRSDRRAPSKLVPTRASGATRHYM